MKNKTECRSGFSLVEVTLALLIVGIGLLSLLGLFGEGLRMSRDSRNDTYVSLFAQTVLEGMRARHQESGGYMLDAPGFNEGNSRVWDSAVCITSDGSQTNNNGYVYIPLEGLDNDEVYKFKSVGPGSEYSLQYNLRHAEQSNLVSVTLHVWTDYLEDIDASSNEDIRRAITFYTEFIPGM